jgi:hypothetical protein
VTADDVLSQGAYFASFRDIGPHKGIHVGEFTEWAIRYGEALLRIAQSAQRVVAVEDITEHADTDEGWRCPALGKYVQEPPDFEVRTLPPGECDCGAQQVIDLAVALDALGED